MATPIHYVHSSSRFSRTPATLWWALLAFLRTYVWLSVIAFTEVGKDSRFQVLTRRNDFHAIQVEKGRGTDESALLLKKKDWQVLRADTVPLNKKHMPTYYFEPLVVTAKNLAKRLAGHRPVVFVVFHFPARAEGANGLRDTPDARAWLEAVRELSVLVRRWEKNVGPVVIFADWNVSWAEAWVRNLLKRELPGVVFSFPKEGTHGRRPIDGVAVYSPKGEIKHHRGAVRVIGAVFKRASDHWPIKGVLSYQ